ncbi:MAG: MFS transporter [Armatimonadota bacterium]
MTRRAVPEGLFLLVLSAIAGLAELAFVIVNIASLPLFLEKGLRLASLPGIAMAVFYTAEAAGNSPMGMLADRLGRRRLMVLGTLLSVATCVGTAFIRLPAESGGWLGLGAVTAAILGMRALDGLGAAMLWPSVFASVADRCPPGRQARAMTLLNVTYLGGIAVGPLAAGLMNDHFGGRYAASDPHRYAPSFFLAAGCFLLASLLSAWVAPGRVEHRGDGPEPPVSAFDKAAFVRTLRRVPALMGLGFLIFLSVGLIGPYAKSYFMDRFGMTESGFGTALLVPALLIGAVSVPLGHVADRWGKTRAIRLGMGLCAAALWGIQAASSQIAVVVLGTVLGLGFVLSFPSYMAYLSGLADPHERGGLIGSVRLAQGVGAFTGAGLASALHVHHAGNLLVFAISSALLTVGFLISLFVLREGSAPSGKGNSVS